MGNLNVSGVIGWSIGWSIVGLLLRAIYNHITIKWDIEPKHQTPKP